MRATSGWSPSKEEQLNKLIAEKTEHMDSVTKIAEIMQTIVEKMAEGQTFSFTKSAECTDDYPWKYTNRHKYEIVI